MSRLHFQSRIDLLQATPGEGDSWRLSFTLADSEGRFKARDVDVDDVLVLDTGAVETGTLTRYLITTVVGTTWDGSVEVIAHYLQDNDNQYPNPSLNAMVGSPGIITRPMSRVGLLPLPSPNTQLIEDRFGFYLQNYNAVVTERELAEANVGLVTVEHITADPQGRYVLPQIPIGDLIWKTAIAYLHDGSAVEMTGVTWTPSDGLAVLELDDTDITWLPSPLQSITVSFLGQKLT